MGKNKFMNHRKINKKFREKYVKNDSKKEKERDYKKLLWKWIFPYCEENRDFFKSLVAAKQDKPSNLPYLIKREWMQDPDIRVEHTAFMDNIQYVIAIVDNLLSELPAHWAQDSSDEEGDHEGGEEEEEKEGDAPSEEDEVDEGGGATSSVGAGKRPQNASNDEEPRKKQKHR
jgi:hypothetical protein